MGLYYPLEYVFDAKTTLALRRLLAIIQENAPISSTTIQSTPQEKLKTEEKYTKKNKETENRGQNVQVLHSERSYQSQKEKKDAGAR